MSKFKHMVPPKGGWKADSWYIVEVCFDSGNPIHTSMFYTGRIDEKGMPSHGNAIYHTAPGSTYEEAQGFHQAYYIKALKLVASPSDMETRNCHELHYKVYPERYPDLDDDFKYDEEEE